VVTVLESKVDGSDEISVLPASSPMSSVSLPSLVLPDKPGFSAFVIGL
jgi:hypothetical protein